MMRRSQVLGLVSILLGSVEFTTPAVAQPAPATAAPAPPAPTAPSQPAQTPPAAAETPPAGSPSPTAASPTAASPTAASPTAEAPPATAPQTATATPASELPPPAPATSTEAAEPSPSVTTPAQSPPMQEEPTPPRQLAVADDGTLKFGALLQFWGFRSSRDDAVTSTFRVRRAEVKLSGEVIPDTIAYKIMVDPAKVLETRSTTVPVEGQDPEPTTAGTVTVAQPADKLSMLQDFAITYLWDYAELSLGQFKNGLSYEGFNSSSKLLFPERSPVAKYYGDKRDVGISVSKEFDHFTYFAGVFNGTGLNLRDTNNQKDLAVRLELLPVEGLLIGAVGYTPLGERSLATTKDRVEADVRLDMANILVQAEYLRGWDGPSDSQVSGQGFYGALGYTFFDRLQPVVRVGQLDTDLDGDGSGGDDELMHYDFGLNYYIKGPRARLSASVSVFDFDQEPTQTDLILMAQASF